jgi:pimeloyl-ACP methyl ester carboxylesterase
MRRWIPAALIVFVSGVLIGTNMERISSVLLCKVRSVCFASARGALVGKIYYPPGLFRKQYPGFLFVHGMLEQGKNATVYSRLAELLARRGYLVLTFDLRGFGDSSKAARLRAADELDFISDVEAALSYMLRQLPVDRENVTIAGHSLGANLAFTVGSRAKMVRNIIALSAGDYVLPEHYPAEFKQHFVDRLKNAIHCDLSPDDWDRLERPLVLSQYLPLRDPKNVLIIVTDCEAAGTAYYNRLLYSELNARKKFLVIPDSNHNLGFDQAGGNELVDPRPLRLIAAGIDEWIKNSSRLKVEDSP